MTIAARTRTLLATLAVISACVAACAVTATRPVQEMSDTTAAIHAAKEVEGDRLAPELFRQANEWFFKARQEYKLRNFKLARDYAARAQRFAEQAEYESLRNKGVRKGLDEAAPPPPAPATPSEPSVEPSPSAPETAPAP